MRHAQAEINSFAGAKLLRFDSIQPRRIFRIRIRLGIEPLDFDLALRRLLIFAEQIFDALRVSR